MHKASINVSQIFGGRDKSRKTSSQMRRGCFLANAKTSSQCITNICEEVFLDLSLPQTPLVWGPASLGPPYGEYPNSYDISTNKFEK